MIELARGLRSHAATLTAAIAIAVMTRSTAYAAGSSMPWEAPLQRILESIEGPVAKIIAVIIIIVTGLTLAFGDTSGGFRRLVQIVFGLSIAFAASSFFLSFFSFGGGYCCDTRCRTHHRLPCAGPSRTDRPDPARRRAARGRHRQRHACGCHQPWPSALAHRHRALGGGALCSGLGDATLYAVICATPRISGREVRS
jgi:type IV secretion system protein VirB2